MRTYYPSRPPREKFYSTTIDFIRHKVIFNESSIFDRETYPILRNRENVDSDGNVFAVTEIARLDTSLSGHIEYEDVSDNVRILFFEHAHKIMLRQVMLYRGSFEVYVLRLRSCNECKYTECLSFSEHYVDMDDKKFMLVLKSLVDFVMGIDIENNDFTGGMEMRHIGGICENILSA